MSFKIQNWKLALLALTFIVIFTGLGCWQLSRATEKKILVKYFTQRTESSPLKASELHGEIRYYQAEISGEFENQHTLLLDNKIEDGQPGYEVYTLFKAQGLSAPILIDRGFVPLTQSRKILPAIRAINGRVTLSGMLNLPPAYVSFGKLSDSPGTSPLRVEYINLKELAGIFQQGELFPYVLHLKADNPAAYHIKWQAVTMQPEKHMGYAIQWFAFALTLLILFVALNRQRKNDG